MPEKGRMPKAIYRCSKCKSRNGYLKILTKQFVCRRCGTKTKVGK